MIDIPRTEFVEFVRPDGRQVPAVIVKVWSKENGCCNLVAFSDDMATQVHASIVFSAEPKPNTWHRFAV